MTLRTCYYYYSVVSAATDHHEMLHHANCVVHKAGRWVWLTSDGCPSTVDNTCDVNMLWWKKLFQVQRLGKSSRGKYPYFEIPEFPWNAAWLKWKEACMPKSSSIRATVLAQYQLVTERQAATGQTHNWYCTARRSKGPFKKYVTLFKDQI